jgi:hypothetical protein
VSVEPILFSARPDIVGAACDPRRPPEERVRAVVVDWERQDKARRQTGALYRIGTDTQISVDTADDLAMVRHLAAGTPVICRINGLGPTTPAEVELATRLGADEILVPMVRSANDVRRVLELVGDRAQVAVMIETLGAVAAAAEIARLPISRAYVGLMDLALDRDSPTIFTAVADGTLERLRATMRCPFGFGGLTLPGRGAPVPGDLLRAEMVRLGCDFSFLRRSFLADVAALRLDPGAALALIRKGVQRAEQRSEEDERADTRRLFDLVDRLGTSAMRTDVSAAPR